MSVPDLDDILDSIPVLFGFPRPDWAKVGRWLATECAKDDRDEVCTDLARQWLATVKVAAGEGYEVFESDNFLILTSAGPTHARNLARVAERALKEMLEGLPGVAQKDGHGKFVCISFADRDSYYEYISHFYPEGEFGASGGVYLSHGYPHFVLNHAAHSSLELVLVHELTHACLGSCPLPLWLEEGVTQIMEEAILGISRFAMNREEVERHQKYWRDSGLRCFWLGESFRRPTVGRELSYDLAEVLTRNLLSRGRDQFLRLLKEADSLDCGDTATKNVYGLGIGDLAAQFLGEGDWEWTPVEAADFYYRALLRQETGEYQRALEDFRVVTELGSEDPDHLNSFAWLLCTCPEGGVRDGEKAVALATRACELTEWNSEAILDTLGAAYAECGDFEKAVRWARKAVELAAEEDRQGDEIRLTLYERGRPYREPPKSTGNARLLSRAPTSAPSAPSVP